MRLGSGFFKMRWWCFLIITLLAGSQPVRSAGAVTICALQGSTRVSPYLGEEVVTEGVVTADFDDEAERGFFMQEADCDGNAGTSDGVFVYLGTMAEVVYVGDRVAVSGVVEEDFGLTRVNTTPAGVSVMSSGHPLPDAVDFAPPFDNTQAADYFEARESMRVQAGSTVVVGPTDARGDTFVVRAELGIERVFQTDPAGTGEIIPVGGDGVYTIEPDAQVGDQVFSLAGVLNYTGGNFRIKLTAPPTLIRPGLGMASAVTGSPTPFSIATLNLHNLFDWVDDPNTEDSVLTGSEFQRKAKKLALTIHAMGEPLLIAVQEAENGTVLQALANRPEIETQYGFVWEDGPDRRGIDVALMYQTDRVLVHSFVYRQGCTTLVDGLGPDGNGDVLLPVNEVTCDTDGDEVDDGNRLFSRPPLLARVQVCEGACGGGGTVREVWVIAVHFKSKSEDTGTVAYTLPRRLQEARYVAGLYQEVLAQDANADIFVLGDLNDYPNSQTLAELTGTGLTNLSGWFPPEGAYTYIYQGVSQILDQVLVSPGVLGEGLFPQIFHLNADYPVSWEGDETVPRRASDHDPVVVYVGRLPYLVWMPVVVKP